MARFSFISLFARAVWYVNLSKLFRIKIQRTTSPQIHAALIKKAVDGSSEKPNFAGRLKSLLEGSGRTTGVLFAVRRFLVRIAIDVIY